ncbi:MAG: hypothetical protein HFJ72_01065 [Adlercreutzia sp.]|uniref:hypothetical protein n=1 Tax=uncultured Adlercreutzia sp. TaxID=875803 RepID=UPI00216EEC9F|nr:hypothetical protein [uncultured Adlercreutzia sp.]MCI8424243.1 hypothetical protein [Adlercreutzia sp.]
MSASPKGELCLVCMLCAFAFFALDGCATPTSESDLPIVSVACSEDELPRQAQGTVAIIDDEKLTIESAGERVTLSTSIPDYPPKEEILQAQIAKLKVGDEVTVSYFIHDGTLVLDSVIQL